MFDVIQRDRGYFATHADRLNKSMGRSATPDDSSYLGALAAFDAIEMQMGEMAAYISDVADALSHDQEGLAASLKTDWPNAKTMFALGASWHECRNALVSAWQKMEPSARALYPLPLFRAYDRSRPVV
ncbi:MAG: hypothetical protein ABMA14_13005 [Hyphomonadaceae bacterium]